MARNKPTVEAQKASEAKVEVSASEVQQEIEQVVSTSEVQLDTLTLEEYLAQTPVNPGLVASFKYEASTRFPETLAPKTVEGWAQAFETQSRREYK